MFSGFFIACSFVCLFVCLFCWLLFCVSFGLFCFVFCVCVFCFVLYCFGGGGCLIAVHVYSVDLNVFQSTLNLGKKLTS